MSVADFNKQHGTPAALPRSRRRSQVLAWPLVFLTLSLFVPSQLYIDIGSFRLSAYRIVLFLIFPFVVSKLVAGQVRLKGYDIAIFLTALWMMIAIGVNHDFVRALESGGIIAFEVVFGYLAARVFLNDRAAIAAFVNLLILCMMVTSVVLLTEIAVGRRLVYEATSWLTGNTLILTESAYRFGSVRAGGPFAHPIHAGVFTMLMLAFALLTSTGYAKRIIQTGLIAAGTIATLSSAPLIGAILQIGLITYHYICGRLRILDSWKLFFFGLAALVIFLEMTSNRGAIKVLVQLTALDPLTGFYRILIWTFGTENVLANPVFGIGHHDWARVSWMVNSSVDAFWLFVAMTYGLPAVAFLGFASIDIFRRITGLRSGLDVVGRHYAQAMLVSLFALIFVGFTVHYWGSAHILYLLMLGMGGSIAAGALTPPQVGRSAGYPLSQVRR